MRHTHDAVMMSQSMGDIDSGTLWKCRNDKERSKGGGGKKGRVGLRVSQNGWSGEKRVMAFNK